MLRLSHPLHLLFAALTYLLGAGIADYLGVAFRPAPFWLGLLGVLLAQLTMSLLPEIFRLDAEPLTEGETRRGRQTLRNNLLYTSLASLAALALIFYGLFATRQLPFSSFLFPAVSLILLLVHSLPPLRLSNRGFGELFVAVHLAYVIPSIAFIFQAGTPHRFLAIAIPLTFLAFACFMTTDFQSFAQDRKFGRATLLTRLGWERVVPFHHIFIIFAYIFFLAMPAFGLTLPLLAPAFLTLPFALYQILQLRNIALGLPPNWKILQATSAAVFGLTAYFLALTFWLR
ncbi:MAG: UbiA family prenyltransferase [Chloroflexi bacterium]|nr:UbiA family prenyltransferase [Chloroflexota bacterium]